MKKVTRKVALCLAVKAAWNTAISVYKTAIGRYTHAGDSFSFTYTVNVTDHNNRWWECKL